MLSIDDDTFEKMISAAMDELPDEYIRNLNNVAVVYADEPTPAQREQLRLRGNQSLFGLYEGVPRTQRNSSYNLVLPDKITIFKLPMLYTVSTVEELKKQVKHTLWHEIAHHYGLDHDRIHKLERQNKKQ